MTGTVTATTTHTTVLLVDDDPDVHDLVVAVLKPLGTSVIVASDGLGGLAAANRLKPDLILLDYDLPLMSGLEVLEQIRQNTALTRVPVIMVTGSDSHSVLASCFTAGAQDYIRKPLFAAELRARVGSAIERQQLMSELVFAAKRDRLTGLPNRAFLTDRLAAATARARREPGFGFTLMFLDFDRFKLINDSLGHDVGDQLLVSIAERLSQNLRASDSQLTDSDSATVARLGGDEFVVLLDGVTKPETAAAIADRLLGALSPVFTLGPHTVRASASIGIACNNGKYETPEDVLRDADIAMYEAKCRGKGCAVMFSHSMRERAALRQAMESELREAIERRTLTIAYQPIISLDDRSLGGVEALARWEHAAFGSIGPLDFIPIAEETRLILPLWEWLLDTVCADYMRWQRELGRRAPVYVSVNLSRIQLTDPTLVERTLATLARTGVRPEQLQLEVTESQIMTDRAGATKLLYQFREAGVRLAMDDFGTGHSSLACLQEFPLDVLKIDREFVANLHRGRDFVALVHAVVTLADNLGLDIVAEGIEDLEQVALLQALGCHQGQGFLLARPMSSQLIIDHVLSESICRDIYSGVQASRSFSHDGTDSTDSFAGQLAESRP